MSRRAPFVQPAMLFVVFDTRDGYVVDTFPTQARAEAVVATSPAHLTWFPYGSLPREATPL